MTKGDVSRLHRIVAAYEQNRPRSWIARAEGVSVSDVTTVLRVAGVEAIPDRITLDRYDMMEYLVNQGASLSEIHRTIKADSRTVKRWFPHAGYRLGSEEHKEAIRLGMKMRELEGRDLL